MGALTQIIQEIKWEQRHDRELAARDREILILRLENYMFRNERGLPPPGLDDHAALTNTYAIFAKTNFALNS